MSSSTTAAPALGSAPRPLRIETLAERQRRRRRLVLALRLGLLVLIVGGWELAVATGILDPFFFGQPSGIAVKLVEWMREGTASARSGGRSG